MNANTPGYWNIGYDPVKGRYGLPAREHPDYKALYKAMKEQEAAHKEWAKRKSDGYMALLDAMTDEERAGLHEQYMADRSNSPYAALYAEAAAKAGPEPVLPDEVVVLLRAAYASNLYRRDGLGDLSVRHDRAGKMAWERELKRLGRK